MAEHEEQRVDREGCAGNVSDKRQTGEMQLGR